MSRYTLEVVEPRSREFPDELREALASALDAIAVVHGGKVVNSPPASPSGQLRRFVNIFDCESLLGGELEWLRETFPDIRFTLKELH